nr:immunoglobulin heavy chain junction region [Macaca mulatta]MOW45831.1 immunoglobulin heavy chain junction region [Macaca mulatta]MOW47164.1 immunoglobulin heavy chain junction region [Macaca mulatta]MOW47588.1 immunoglobulin heavy chain junction region [Macaca mulatta]MOW47816.1 immunoglobulin heavy chain junction region [Macaca mulatta]
CAKEWNHDYGSTW